MTFKKGDRVAVYGPSQGGMAPFARKTGTVVYATPDNYPAVPHLNVRIDGPRATTYTFHPKQCRRLKKPARR